MPVHAGTTTRLAYRGDHLRFIDVNRDLANGTPVPLTLVFKDAAGREVRATTDVVVRGLLLPQHMPPASRDASSGAPAPSAPEPAPKM
jgi:copper(I)-binding protein